MLILKLSLALLPGIFLVLSLAEGADYVVLPLFNISKHHQRQLLSRRLGQSWKRRNREPTRSRISMQNLLSVHLDP
jgi:hypothetical protein